MKKEVLKDPLRDFYSTEEIIEYCSNLSEENQIRIINSNYYGVNIEYIRDPSEKVQIEALKIHLTNIKHINNATENAEIYFVNQLLATKYIGNMFDDFINKKIKSKKAIDLYYKLKTVSKIVQ
jgi:hypothetical protein